jgi:hypothetical protein
MTMATTTTAADLRDLATPVRTAEVADCGCIATPDHFYPCAACKAEVWADLAEVYADDGRQS